MPRSTRFTVLFASLLAVVALGLTSCGGDDDPPATDDTDATTSSEAPTSEAPSAESTNASKSCQTIAGSGAVEDVQEVFDKYKGNTKAFTPADEKAMRDALDRLAKAGDNASPKIREDVVELVAAAGSQIDSRAGLPGTGQVASNESIQKQLDALCR